MDGTAFKLAELFMVMIGIGGFILWQIIDVRRARDDTTPSPTFTGRASVAPVSEASTVSAGHAEGQQELHPGR